SRCLGDEGVHPCHGACSVDPGALSGWSEAIPLIGFSSQRLYRGVPSEPAVESPAPRKAVSTEQLLSRRGERQHLPRKCADQQSLTSLHYSVVSQSIHQF